jgi:putative endopeptidase
VNLVYDYLPDLFSKIFWEKEGDPALIPEIENFSNSLKESAKHRLQITEWMKPETRKAAIEKVSSMDFQVVRPKTWNTFVEPELGNNLLKNFFALGEAATKTLISRLGKNYNSWQEGIYRVNAYYFMENNRFIIPYASCMFPFYIGEENIGWNYGGLGGIIGHELCHGFDEDGKEYNEKGERKRWWTRSDVAAYNKKTRELVKLYSQQKMEGIHINGMRTLSENIADIGGLGIALYALKEKLRIQEFDAARVKEEYKKFFISFATSWRTKYRDTKLKRLLKMDVHSPASLRVNLVVSQFDEWYYAFDIEKGSDYVKPEDRIRIF